MLKSRQVVYQPVRGDDDFLLSFYRDVYDFCFDHGYTFITYAHPGSGSEGLEKSKEFGKPKRKSNKTSRGERIIISRNLNHKPLSDIREFDPAHPGFFFTPFAGNLDHNSSFSYYEVDVIIPLGDWKREKKGGKYQGKIIYRNNSSSAAMFEGLRDYLGREDRKDKKNRSEIYTFEEDEGRGKSLSRNPKNNSVSTVKQDFHRQVKRVKDRLTVKLSSKDRAHPTLTKVVLSKLKLVTPKTDFDIFKIFLKMVKDFPFSFINLVSGSEVGTWLGASPEVLVKRDRSHIFQTVSLAGTQWLNGGFQRTDFPVLSEVAWTQKEIEEQSVTSRFIIDQFKKLRLREYIEEGPATVRKGNLLHLQSTFTVDLKRHFGDTLPYEMIALLHPTPAVAGTPRLPAIREIQGLEKHDRRHYAGYLGPVDIDHSIDVYVNLRCMQCLKIKGRLVCAIYAGAGINRFSIPEKEWLETEAKTKWLELNLKN